MFALLGFIISKPNPKHHGCPGIIFFVDPGKDYPGSTFCAPDPKIYLPIYDPDWPKPPGFDPTKCSRYPDTDGPPYVLYAGPDPIKPLVRCGLFRPIPQPKCVPTGGGPIGDPPMHPQPDYPIW